MKYLFNLNRSFRLSYVVACSLIVCLALVGSSSSFAQESKSDSSLEEPAKQDGEQDSEVGASAEVSGDEASEESTEDDAQDTDEPESDKKDEEAKPAIVSVELVNELIAQLDSETMTSRDEAEKKLIALGPSVLAFLPKVNANTGAEVRVRLQRIEEGLRSQSIQEFVEPSTVTLSGKMTVSKALASISSQTGNTLDYELESNAEIEVNFEKEVFWKALDTVLDAANLDVNINESGTNSLKIMSRPSNYPTRSENVCYTSVFRLMPIRAVNSRSMVTGVGDLKLTVAVAWEPRLAPIYFQFPMNNLKAMSGEDEIGAFMADAAPEYSPLGYNSQIEVELSIERPAREVTELKSLKGEFRSALPGKMVSLSFENLDKPGKKATQVGNLSVALESILKNGGVYEFRTLIELTSAGQTMDSFRGWVLGNEAYLLDKEGKRIENVNWNTYRLGASQVGIAYLFPMPDGPAGYRFVYDAPGAVSEQTLPYEFESIPLP